VSAHRHRRLDAGARARLIGGILAAIALALNSCSALNHRPVNMEPVSIQTVEYYPFQVKGYENTYPKRRVVIVPTLDARDFRDIGGAEHQPYEGHPAIGVVLGRTGKTYQRLYGPPINPLIEDAIAHAAQEAGMIATASTLPLKRELAARDCDYVIAAKITRLWVNKHRGPDTEGGVTWFAAADVALDVSIYKPPFEVAFWEGESAATYDDPPPAPAGVNPEDETEIYDEPGQVLSVALTRAVAGIFKRDSLHMLIVQDSPPGH
jgi:hypothetical protein